MGLGEGAMRIQGGRTHVWEPPLEMWVWSALPTLSGNKTPFRAHLTASPKADIYLTLHGVR